MLEGCREIFVSLSHLSLSLSLSRSPKPLSIFSLSRSPNPLSLLSLSRSSNPLSLYYLYPLIRFSLSPSLSLSLSLSLSPVYLAYSSSLPSTENLKQNNAFSSNGKLFEDLIFKMLVLNVWKTQLYAMYSDECFSVPDDYFEVEDVMLFCLLCTGDIKGMVVLVYLQHRAIWYRHVRNKNKSTDAEVNNHNIFTISSRSVLCEHHNLPLKIVGVISTFLFIVPHLFICSGVRPIYRKKTSSRDTDTYTMNHWWC